MAKLSWVFGSRLGGSLFCNFIGMALLTRDFTTQSLWEFVGAQGPFRLPNKSFGAGLGF